LLITRKKRNGIEYITQIGTGNYNEKTARFYTDMCLMTSHKGIGEDAANFFNSLFMGSMVDASEHLLVAPLCLKSKIMAMIDEEISFAKKDLPAQIILKLNSISDKEVIDKLIEAAGYGVKIKMIVRGICCFKPFLTQGEQNIEIISIVGRFLEHSRVYVFGLEERQSVYISSADFMTRNTDRRVEVAAPVYDPVIKDSILNIVEMTFMDNVKSRMLMPNGTYEYKKDKTGGFESQLYLYKQAYCLSGKKFYQEPTKKKKYFLKFK
jgi:polyphosphate kinase